MAFEGRARVGSTTERDGHNDKTRCKGYEIDKTSVRVSRNVSGSHLSNIQDQAMCCFIQNSSHEDFGSYRYLQELYLAGSFVYSWSIHPAFVV